MFFVKSGILTTQEKKKNFSRTEAVTLRVDEKNSFEEYEAKVASDNLWIWNLLSFLFNNIFSLLHNIRVLFFYFHFVIFFLKFQHLACVTFLDLLHMFQPKVFNFEEISREMECQDKESVILIQTKGKIKQKMSDLRF